jgi:hypothetical protein
MKPMPIQRRQTNGRIFAMPLLIGVLSLIGLVAALVGDGLWNALSWIALAIPIALCGYFLLRRRQ